MSLTLKPVENTGFFALYFSTKQRSEMLQQIQHPALISVAVRMECSDIIIQSHDHLFYKLAMHALSVRFSHVNSDAMAVEFVFPSI